MDKQCKHLKPDGECSFCSDGDVVEYCIDGPCAGFEERSQNELLPCPFCGSEALLDEIKPHTHVLATWMPDYVGGGFVECTGCSAAISESNAHEAIVAWNRRAQHVYEPLTVEELRSMDGDISRTWVWIEVIEQPSYPTIHQQSGCYRSDHDYSSGRSFCCGWPGLGFSFDYADYGKTWIAYRHRPEGE